MGKINLTALRVRRRALADIQAGRAQSFPVWLNAIADIPPAQILTRQQPIPHPETQVRMKTVEGKRNPVQVVTVTQRRKPKSAKASRLFSPVEIKYEEDKLRQQFFQDHPWELARPRVVVETTGNQHKQSDFSKSVSQPHLQLSGENVVQRQLHLLENVPDMSVESAYDVARREFYHLRRREAVQRRVAKEEAEHMGAEPEEGVLQWGMRVENKWYNDWQEWSEGQVMEQMQRSAAFSDSVAPVDDTLIGGTTPDEPLQLQERGQQSQQPQSQQQPQTRQQFMGRGGAPNPFAVQQARNEKFARA